jgi:hypothetical protein
MVGVGRDGDLGEGVRWRHRATAPKIRLSAGADIQTGSAVVYLTRLSAKLEDEVATAS